MSRQPEPDFVELSAQTYRLCLSLLRDRSDAAEAAQEALMRAWADRSRRRPEVAWSTWVGGFAVRVCRETARRRSITVAGGPEAAAGALEDPPFPPFSEAADRIHRAIAGLPDRQREVVTLRWLLGYSTAAAAAVLGCPEGTVKSNLYKAVARLRQTLPVYVPGNRE